MLKNLIQKIKSIFKKNAKIKEYKSELLADLSQQANTVLRIGGIIVSVAWLGFAFDTDPKLHPEFTELLYFRLGLTFFGILMIVWSFIPALKDKTRFLIIATALYTVSASGFFTGVLANDPNYVSGYQLAIMIIVLAPILFKEFIIILTISLLLFLTGVYVYSPKLEGVAIQYSMNNLVITYVFSTAFAYFIQRFRISLLIQNIKVTNLKEKQDGDYFLTSNLINPLLINENQSKNVEIDFFTSQFKKFKFKKWNSEIGGDYSSAYNINLRGRDYTIFVNADAMGKSIQGAGGVLVFATVFKSIISRTQKSSTMSEKYPEQWLKICFIELQDIFITFDGSMLISAVIGLIDNESGLFYYINAEHPSVVLYRNEKASFIEDSALLRKIGIEGFGSGVQIKVLQLKNKDVIILGSDGRDDILLGTDKEGRRIINEDENLFLRNIEKSDSVLDKIYSEVLKLGSVIDDFALIRIQYFSNEDKNIEFDKIELSFDAIDKEIQNQNYEVAFIQLEELLKNKNITVEIIRRLYRLSIKLKNIESVYKLCQKYTEKYPAHLDVLYFMSYISKLIFQNTKKKDYLMNAADYGERYRLRNKHNFKNLINLANIYILMKNTKRAIKLLKEAEEIDSTNKNLIQLQDVIKNM